ncbi:hypothetical protein [Fretibacter rubidus]|uniref:hypothetical protein n=1 Tax=Fretibacter rubidus TaxID=570162 RepID=UPI00352A6617
MDSYPPPLSPIMSKTHDKKTPFDVWWPTVKPHFPNVPDIIAKDWLYEHWGSSPFSWIQSRRYDFVMEEMPAAKLPNVLSRVFGFTEGGGPIAHETGRFLCGDQSAPPTRPWRNDAAWLVSFMKRSGSFPSPIIVLDNRDAHLAREDWTPQPVKAYPKALLLAEGHTRHVIGLHLLSTAKLKDRLPICRLILKSDN